MTNALKEITELLINFRNERDWQHYHNPKDVALSLSLEAAELLELFQWKDKEQVAAFVAEKPEALKDELADVFNWVLILAHDAGIDILEASRNKISKNALKYPVEKAKGTSHKYTNLK